MILASLAGAPAIASGTGDGFVAGNQTLALADLPSQPSQDALTPTETVHSPTPRKAPLQSETSERLAQSSKYGMQFETQLEATPVKPNMSQRIFEVPELDLVTPTPKKGEAGLLISPRNSGKTPRGKTPKRNSPPSFQQADRASKRYRATKPDIAKELFGAKRTPSRASGSRAPAPSIASQQPKATRLLAATGLSSNMFNYF